jgi:hypothetical protein
VAVADRVVGLGLVPKNWPIPSTKTWTVTGLRPLRQHGFPERPSTRGGNPRSAETASTDHTATALSRLSTAPCEHSGERRPWWRSPPVEALRWQEHTEGFCCM